MQMYTFQPLRKKRAMKKMEASTMSSRLPERELAEEDGTLTERLDDILWPLLPFVGARAATLQGGELAYGTITAVHQTVVAHEILYVLLYDDGDVQHLDALQAANATALVLTTNFTPSPPLRTLRRQEANAHLHANAHNSTWPPRG